MKERKKEMKSGEDAEANSRTGNEMDLLIRGNRYLGWGEEMTLVQSYHDVGDKLQRLLNSRNKTT